MKCASFVSGRTELHVRESFTSWCNSGSCTNFYDGPDEEDAGDVPVERLPTDPDPKLESETLNDTSCGSWFLFFAKTKCVPSVVETFDRGYG